ncbi:unnamed protein product, partial [Medioppia subpectinata]
MVGSQQVMNTDDNIENNISALNQAEVTTKKLYKECKRLNDCIQSVNLNDSKMTTDLSPNSSLNEDNSVVKMMRVSQQMPAYYEAEARLAARREARTKAREIRLKELEKQQNEINETSDRHYELFGNPITSSATKTPVTAR